MYSVDNLFHKVMGEDLSDYMGGGTRLYSLKYISSVV